MLAVLWPAEKLFVGNDVFESYAGNAVEDLSRIDQLVDTNQSVWPGMAHGDPIADLCDLVSVFRKKGDGADVLGFVPSWTTTQYIEVTDLIDPTSKKQGSATEESPISQRKI